MRQDQFEKLQALEEKLLDVFLAEADPATWPGAGIPLGQMDAKMRGDTYWTRKTAASVLVLATKVQQTISGTQGNGLGTTPAAGDGADLAAKQQAHAEQQLDDDYARAERQADSLMRELQTRKAAFDRRVHGKA